MSWVATAILAWVALGLEIGLKEVLTLRLGSAIVTPGFVLPLAVFVAMCAPAVPALWTCLALGLAMDLTGPVTTDSGAVLTIAGPNALGFLLAGQFVLGTRAMMIRRNPLTLGFLSLIAGAIAHVVVAAIFTVRAVYDVPIISDAGSPIVSRLLSAAYTGAVAVLLAFALLPLAPLLGFQLGHGRALPRRAYERR